MAKRENGAGTEVQWDEEKQLYYQRFGYKDKTGKSRVKAIYGKTKGEITEKRKEWRKTLASGIDVTRSKMTFDKWLGIWLSTYKKGLVEDSSHYNYRHYAEHHIIPELGKITLKDLNRSMLQKFINDKAEELASGTLGLVRVVLNNSLRMAVEDDILLKNPASRLKLPKTDEDERDKVNPFTVNELKAILKILEGTKYYWLVYLAPLVGMRRGELLGLKRKPHINFAKKEIHVRQQLKLDRDTRKNIIGKLKTKAAYRDIPINDKIKNAFKKQFAWQAARKLELGSSNNYEYVFTDETGNHLTGGSVTIAFMRACKKANVEYRSFHCLRHTFASIAISKGINIKAISEILGHAGIEETLNIYGHLLPGDSQAVMIAVADFLADL